MPYFTKNALKTSLYKDFMYYQELEIVQGGPSQLQSLAPDQSTMIIQRRNADKKVWTAKTHYYALRTDFHFLCGGLGTGIF